MALTPLTVPRRNVVPLYFDVTGDIPEATGAAAVNYSLNAPYPAIVMSGADGDEADQYKVWYINNDGERFGAYYDELNDSTDFGGTRGMLSRDKTKITLTNYNFWPSRVFYKDLDVSIDTYGLNVPRLPSDEGFYFDSGEFGVGGGGNVFLPVYNIGGVKDLDGHQTQDPVTGHYYLRGKDWSKYKAFEKPEGFGGNYMQFVTLSDDDFNYSFVGHETVSETGNTVYMSKWTAVAGGDPFSYTNYSIQLDDDADDAVFQAAADYASGMEYRMRGNYEVFWFGIDVEEYPLTQVTVFVFAKDFSWYDRLDITANGDLDFGTYWQTIEGKHMLVGTRSDSTAQAYQFASNDPGPEPSLGEPKIQVWSYTLDGHDNYVLHCGQLATLVYDTHSQEWYNWGSGNSTIWRARTGCNWLAGRKFSEDWSGVIAGDSENGTLYFLSPDDDYDDDSDEGAATPRSFTRQVTGQIVVRPGYASRPCFGVQLLGSIGSVSDNLTVNLSVSDDRGFNYDDMGSLSVSPGDYSARLNWLSLGSMDAPGRLFRITDTGALKRIDALEMDD
ncbi:hypothetical protein NT2_01_04650 [Caenibius tardaugens NBRC 16725]|uniref:Uncharacterized protein n=1 Tax=Caenibius tardaugens NBRC 16725 TaxID=1219035 RepID=U2YI33_9SPHN|nr:hypothetical protein [Caenibius tardaugens]AZI37076.1 hypothetical protein EGO55_14820 [Caenibius tardaugens NBRC 16725]GAD47692.1 hypothetical protein NT2_01_04650 [Caenibius tardaugens NBRC 16725]